VGGDFTITHGVGVISGVILHEAGGRWTQVSSPPTGYLSQVTVDASGQGWAVGGDFTITHGVDVTSGVILHEAGGQWMQVSSPSTGLLSGVAVDASGQAWAVGQDLDDGGALLLYSPVDWLAVHT
jgi:hypothetical protein